MTDPRTEAVVGVVRGMSKGSPKPMLKRVQFELDEAGVPGEFAESDLVEMLTSSDVNGLPATSSTSSSRSGTRRPTRVVDGLLAEHAGPPQGDPERARALPNVTRKDQPRLPRQHDRCGGDLGQARRLGPLVHE